jgi:dynein light intermediate chain 1
MKTLEKWMTVLRSHIDELKIPPKQLKELEERNVKAFQEYTDPDGTVVSPTGTTHTSAEETEANIVLPLADNVLSRNLGIPVVIACNKCDLLSSVEKEREYKEEHLDFIQQHVRKFCLNCSCPY